MVGLTSLIVKDPPMAPRLDLQRAHFVLGQIDEILAWDRAADRQRDSRFVELGKFLCEVRAGQYWRMEKLGSFDEFLESRFPGSRRKAYYLMSIHEHLPKKIHAELGQVGWAKAAEMVKLVRHDPEHFDCATWLHKAKELPKEQFKDEIEKCLTGNSEASDLVYFKLFKSQIPVVEEALEVTARMLGSDKSRGYCLEMICADFLAGAAASTEDDDLLLRSLARYFSFLPEIKQREFLEATYAQHRKEPTSATEPL